MVSRNRPGVGDDVSITACRLCGSTAEVSQESNPSSVVLLSRYGNESKDAGRREDRWLLDNSLVFEEIGRTTCDNDERIDVNVSVADRPPLDPGGLLESIDVLPRVFEALGLVCSYGMDLTCCGDRRPPS